ncbi:MAG: hypothetical protein M0C28_13015 [Candidatus Moduliflexus flocculans]|nr:hypothetical protein [Candidatus Moduliflexus flocculans]
MIAVDGLSLRLEQKAVSESPVRHRKGPAPPGRRRPGLGRSHRRRRTPACPFDLLPGRIDIEQSHDLTLTPGSRPGTSSRYSIGERRRSASRSKDGAIRLRRPA